ncbi:hypothetical protein SAMN04489727_1735 [Amycolatopsis tolypomycina]|uniref:Uncharacterized protein n=1 Tax=Amycolatopsis tolypomycina TaxID=208445 RepID=A0A1H4JC88_9PSEU|nr:hypothetical protein [Amycolatopsis tolypomycina]SEB43695.1 hypothetical protein SAMN04489727_1735 [Amycolatopsis tolypomycina]
MRTMYDAVTARNILNHDRTPEMVAGYVDRIKLAPWSPNDWALFPDAVKVEIVKKASSNFGHVLDVEPGDATPAEAPGWVRMRRAAGADPTVYMNLSTWPAVRAEFVRQGVAQPHYWVARYDNDPDWGAGWAELGCVAKQHTANYRGVDINSVADHWPGVDTNNAQEEDVQEKDVRDIWTMPAIVQDEINPKDWLAPGKMLAYVKFDTFQLVKKLDALTATVTQLTQLVLKGGDVDEAALAKALDPTITAAITTALAGSAPGTPEENAQATIDALRAVLGSAPAAGA